MCLALLFDVSIPTAVGRGIGYRILHFHDYQGQAMGDSLLVYNSSSQEPQQAKIGATSIYRSLHHTSTTTVDRAGMQTRGTPRYGNRDMRLAHAVGLCCRLSVPPWREGLVGNVEKHRVTSQKKLQVSACYSFFRLF